MGVALEWKKKEKEKEEGSDGVAGEGGEGRKEEASEPKAPKVSRMKERIWQIRRGVLGGLGGCVSGSDGELGSRDGKVRWRGGVSDAEVNEGCVVREESEDVGSEGRAEVGGFDLSRSTKLLNERSEMSN